MGFLKQFTRHLRHESLCAVVVAIGEAALRGIEQLHKPLGAIPGIEIEL
jgi:hypothetical protein